MTESNELYARYNVDDVFNRVVIIGLLNLLNNEITYEQIIDTNVVETVHVPFMYDFGTSDERFAQDNYTFFGTACFGEKKIDGKFDMFPRGALRYTGSQIDNANFTNRFVKGTYLKNENGKLTTYMSFLSSIPLTLSFECEMWMDNIINAFKIEQAIRDTFYKNRTFNVLFKGMKVGCRVGFPESHNIEKTTEYSFDTERKIKMTFSLAVEAYQPTWDDTMSIEADKRIERIAYDTTLMGSSNKLMNIKFKEFNNSSIIPSGSNIMLEWTSFSNVSDMCTVLLYYIDENGEKHNLDTPIFNQKSYSWHIPEGFTEYIQPSITYDAKVIKTPDIKLIPNAEGKFDADSFIILDPGLFEVSEDTEYVKITLDYVNKKTGKVEISESRDYDDNGNETYPFYLKLKSRQIDINNPVAQIDTNFIYKNSFKPKRVSLQIEYPLDRSVFDKIDNVLIL